MSYTVGETKITADGADRIALCARDLDANGGKAIALLYGPDRLANAHLFQAAHELLVMLQNLLEVYSKPDRQMCCDGRECGCMGSTVYDEAEHYARAAIAKATQS